MTLSQLKADNQYRNLKPFQSNLYEDVKIDEADEFTKKDIVDNSIQGYIQPGKRL